MIRTFLGDAAIAGATDDGVHGELVHVGEAVVVDHADFPDLGHRSAAVRIRAEVVARELRLVCVEHATERRHAALAAALLEHTLTTVEAPANERRSFIHNAGAAFPAAEASAISWASPAA